jgi:hypothetical protein
VVAGKLEDLYREAAGWTSVRCEASGAARPSSTVENPAAIPVTPWPMAKP